MNLINELLLNHEAIRNIGLILIAAVGFPFIVWRTKIANKQVQTANIQIKISEANHVSDLYMKCIELLGAIENGNHSIERRIGAIYGLEKIANNNQDEYYHQVIKTYRHP
ncbi:hypothetical protein [Shewanella waksmanii]|uniref:hypothetical protein n=1 Tax=Shewanella waksmanii TaxID=213783 RepID=UPI0037358336